MAGDSREINIKVRVGAEGVQNITMTERGLDKLDRSARKADQGMGKAGRAAGTLGRGLAALPPQLKLIIASVTLLISLVAALGVAGTTAFAAVQSQMGVVSTMLDETSLGMERYKAHLEEYGDGVRQLSTDMGEGTQTLSKGLYDILSASVAPAKAMEVLTISAKAAKAGITDTATSVDFITSALNAYGLAADEAGRVSDIAFATVASGKLTFQELAANIGEVAPTANMAGVSLEALGAMMATTTKSGIKAAEASTAINQFLLSFIQAGPKAAAAWAELSKGTDLQGQAWSGALLKGENLIKTLEVLRGANEKQLTSIFNNVRALKAANVLSKQADDYRQNLARTTNSLGETERAYNKVSGNLSHRWSQLKQMAKDLTTTIGEGLAPVIQGITDRVVAWYKSNGKLLKTDILIWVERLKRGLGGVKDLLTWGGGGEGAISTELGDTSKELAEARRKLEVAKANRSLALADAQSGNPLYEFFAQPRLAKASREVASLSAEVDLLSRKLGLLAEQLKPLDRAESISREGDWSLSQKARQQEVSDLAGLPDDNRRMQAVGQVAKGEKAVLRELSNLKRAEYQKDLARIDTKLAKLRSAGASEVNLAQYRAELVAEADKKQANREEAARKKELSAWQNQNKAILDMAGQRHKAWELLHGNIREGAQAAADTERKLDAKALRDKKTYFSLVAELSGDTNAKRLAAYQEFKDQVEKLDLGDAEQKRLLALKWRDLNKSTFDRMLEDWSDTNKILEETNQLTWESIRNTIKTGIHGIIHGEDGWNSLTDAFRSMGDLLVNIAEDIASQIVEAFALRGLAWLLSGGQMPGGGGFWDGLLNLGSGGSGGGGGPLGTVSSVASIAGIGSKIAGWLGLGGPSVTGAGGSLGLGAGAAGSIGALAGGAGSMGGGIGGAMSYGMANLGIGGAGAGGAGGAAAAGLGVGALGMAGVLGPIGIAAAGGLIMSQMATQMSPEEAQDRLEQDLGVMDEFISAGRGMSEVFAETARHFDLMSTRTGYTAEQLDAMTATLGETGDAMYHGASAATEMSARLETMAEKVTASADHKMDLANATNELAGYMDYLNEALSNATDGTVQLDDKSQELVGMFLSGEITAKEFAESMEGELLAAMQAALDQGGLVTDQMRDLAEALKAVPTEWSTNYTYTEDRYINTYHKDMGETAHTGGLIRHHAGGMVQAALAAGLISRSGGRMHTGGAASGLAADEVFRILQLGEFVVQRNSVTAATLPVLADINERGEAALASYMPLTSPQEGPAPAPTGSRSQVFQIGPIYVTPVSGDKAEAEAYGDTIAERVMERLKDASEAGQGVLCEDGVYSRRFGHA